MIIVGIFVSIIVYIFVSNFVALYLRAVCQLRDVYQKEDIGYSGLHRKNILSSESMKFVRPDKRRLRMMTLRMRLNLTRTRLVLLAGRSLKMAALIVVERNPRTSSDCDYS